MGGVCDRACAEREEWRTQQKFVDPESISTSLRTPTEEAKYKKSKSLKKSQSLKSNTSSGARLTRQPTQEETQSAVLKLQSRLRGTLGRIRYADIYASKHEALDSGPLGSYKQHYMVVSNKPECDEHYASSDPGWLGRASMSKHHRFLIRKDLHWQWFNALTFGMLNKAEDESNATAGEAAQEVETMLKAAQTYAKAAHETMGWSSNVGYYYHVYGHNSVNSMHLHIVDLDHTGPSYEHAQYKNIPAEEVLTVLREEASGAVRLDEDPASQTRCTCFPFLAKDRLPEGQTLKAELVQRHPQLNDAEAYRCVRRTLQSLGGVPALREELELKGFLLPGCNMLTTNTIPFNVFARLAKQAKEKEVEVGVVATLQSAARERLRLSEQLAAR